MKPPKLALQLLLGAACVAAWAPARADVAALVLDGDVPPHEREVAAAALTTAAEQEKRPFVKRAFPSTDITTLKMCVPQPQPWTCAAPVVRDHGLDQLAIVTLTIRREPDGGTSVVLAAAVIGANLPQPITDQRECRRCTDGRLTELADRLGRDLVREVATRLGRTAVSIRSTPPGARITLDGKPAGVTDLVIKTYPGPHTVELARDGYAVTKQTVEAVENATTPVTVALHSPGGGGSRWPLVPAVVVGAGALALATGVILIAIDEDPVSSPDQDASPTYRDSATGGAIIGAAGLVAAGVGGYLWWRYMRSAATPAVASTAGGAILGFSRRF
jgi:hypothetical protein